MVHLLFEEFNPRLRGQRRLQAPVAPVETVPVTAPTPAATTKLQKVCWASILFTHHEEICLSFFPSFFLSFFLTLSLSLSLFHQPIASSLLLISIHTKFIV